MPNPEPLIRPPFPPLAWEQFVWTGKDELPAWAGFQDRSGPYGSLADDGKPSTGRLSVFVKPPPGQPPRPPAPEQAAAYAYLKQNDRTIAAAAIQAIFEKYPQWQEAFDLDDDEREECMPDITKPDELKRLMGLNTVHVLDIAKDGYAYFGLEIGCTWEDEHGVGILFHKDRLIKMGGASESFNVWPAKDDGGQELR